MSDVKKKCVDCGQEFILTSGEREFYRTKIMSDGKPMLEPKRCSRCRASRKALRGGMHHPLGGEHKSQDY